MASHTSPLSPTRHLQSTKPPWTILVVLKTGQRAEAAITIPAGYILRVVRGTKCRYTAGLFSEFATAMDFPDYFGHNWDAFDECLREVDGDVVLLVHDAASLWRDAPSVAGMLVDAWLSAAQDCESDIHLVFVW